MEATSKAGRRVARRWILLQARSRAAAWEASSYLSHDSHMASHVAIHVPSFREMQPSRSMTVSDLKNKLLDVVRDVEKGEVVEITKDGEPVAVLSPHKAWNRPATGFARVVVKGSLELPDAAWTYDLPNLRPKRKRKS